MYFVANTLTASKAIAHGIPSLRRSRPPFRRYSYRRPSVLIAGTAIALVTGGFGIHLIIVNRHRLPQGAEEWLVLLFVGGILGLLFTCGLFFVGAYIRNQTIDLEITFEGVRYGKNAFPWSDIRWINGVWSRDRYQLAIGRRGFRPDQHLMTDHGLNEPDFDRLMETLRQKVLPAHPTLTVSDTLLHG